MARIARATHGVVTRGQLLRAGITAREVERRLEAGSLLREHRGVYRVGHRAPSVEARYIAAVRAAGDGALLSGRAAGYVLGILKGKPPPPEVTAPSEKRVRGVIVRRSRSLDRREATIWRGITVTTIPRTLVDLAAVPTFDGLSRACHEAGVLHRTTPAQVERVLARRANSPGTPQLRRILRGEARVTLSKLEAGSWRSCGRRTSPFRRPTARPADAAWTAAGQRSG